MGSSDFVTAASTVQPVALTVAANTAVTWTNDSGIEHTVTFDDPATALAVGTGGTSGTFDAPASSTNQRQFAVSGTSHPFHCTIHAGMSGIVNVQ
jgi:plastocyanin